MIGVCSSRRFSILPAIVFWPCQVGRGGRDVLLGQGVVGRVLEVGGVPRPRALQRSRQEDVGHAAVAVVDQAHGAVQPVGLAEDGLAVVLRRRLDREPDVDADLGRRRLDDLGELRDLEEVLGEELGREAARVPRRRKQLLGLASGPAPAGRRWCRWRGRPARTGCRCRGRPCPGTGPVTMSGRFSVSATAWRTRGSVNGAWSQRIESSRCALDLQVEHGHARAREQRLAARHRELADDVDRPALQRQDLGLLGVVEGELGAVGERLLAPVGLVADERRAHLGGVASSS